MQRVKRRKSLVCIFLSAIFFACLIGCTRPIRQSSNLSQAGIKYADAMSTLLDVATDTIIDSDTYDLLYQQELISLENKEEERKKLKDVLDNHNKAVKDLIETIGSFQFHIDLIKDYFTNLDALANASAPETAAFEAGELSGKINEAGKVILKKDVLISNDEKEAIGKLTGIVAGGFQSAMLRNALKRDAPIIGEQLLLQEKLLEKLSGMLNQRYREHMTIMEKDKIRKPYVNKTMTNVEEWKESRSQFLKSVFLDQNLETAQGAVKEMRLIWENILNGKQDIGSIQSALSDMNEFVNAINQLKVAIQARRESK
ncbi:MAG: hypothetical protein CV087_20770 [Candidatus Brocadia sp. WS118]|nr:MAG: hypothetical protein CV087_20770 [Candidatus Brocadia sp. WS118]